MRYEPLSPGQLNALDIPPIEYVVDDVLPQGACAELVAREKTGKSLMLIDMLVSIAAGEPFLDRAVSQGPTALVAMEDSLREARTRLNNRLNGLVDIPVFLLPCDGSIPDLAFSLEHPESLDNLATMIAEYGLVAVGIDPLRETHHVAENDSDSMAPLLRPLRQIAHETNCAIVMTHHANKAGGSRGSTAIDAAFDQILKWNLTDPDAETLSGILHIKGRYGPRTAIRASFAEHGRWALDTSVILPTNTRARITAFLEDASGWHSAKAIVVGLADSAVTLKTVQNLVTDLVRAGDVIRQGTGKPGDPFTYAVKTTSRLFPDIPGNSREECSRAPDLYSAGRSGTLHGHPKTDTKPVCENCGQPRTRGVPCLHCGLSVDEARAVAGMAAQP